MDYQIRLSRKNQKDTFKFSHISNDVPVDDFTFVRNPHTLLYERESTESRIDRMLTNADQIIFQVQKGFNKKGALETFLQSKFDYTRQDAKACLEHLVQTGKLVWSGTKTRGWFEVPGPLQDGIQEEISYE
jgi:hypothetical protein